MATESKEAVFLKQPPKIMGRDVSNPVISLNSSRDEILQNLMISTTNMQSDLRSIKNDQISTNKALLKEIQTLNKQLKLQIKGEKQEREDAKKRDQRLSNRIEKQLRGKKGTASNPLGGSANSTASKSFLNTLGKGLLAALFPGAVKAGMGGLLGAVLFKPLKGALGLVSKALTGLAKFLGINAFGKWLKNLILAPFKRYGTRKLIVQLTRRVPKQISGWFKTFADNGGLPGVIFRGIGKAGKGLGKGVGKAGGWLGSLFGNLFKANGKTIGALGKNGVAKGTLSPVGKLLGSIIGQEKLVAMMSGVKGAKMGGILGKGAEALGKAGGWLGSLFGKKATGTALATVGATTGAKGLGKLGVKGLGIAGKKVPLLGALIGAGFATDRALKGDWLGAGAELTSGLLGGSGIGIAGSIGIDAWLMKRDMDREKEKFKGSEGKGLFDTIKDWWQGIVDWFKNTWLGKLISKNKDNTGNTPKSQPITANGKTYNNIDDAISNGVYMSRPSDKNANLMSTPDMKPQAQKLMSTMNDKPKTVSPQGKTLTGTNAELIWGYLKEKGFSDNQIAGIMGNLQAESGLEFGRLQGDFGKDRSKSKAYTQGVNAGTTAFVKKNNIGYGLAQWTYGSRKQGLLAEAKRRGVSIDDPKLQLDYLYAEMENRGVSQQIKQASSIQEASNIMLKKFEQPKDMGYGVQNTRAAMGNRILKAQQSGTLASYTPSTISTISGVMQDADRSILNKVGTTADIIGTSLKDTAVNFFKSLEEQTKDSPFLSKVVQAVGDFGKAVGENMEDLKPRYSSDKPDFWQEFRGVNTNNVINTRVHETAVELDEKSQLAGLGAMGSKFGTKPVAPDRYNATVQTNLPGVDTNQLMMYQLFLQN